MEYRVTWTIEIEAESAKEAAKTALFIQRDPYSTATFFEVTPKTAGGKTKTVRLALTPTCK
jgi:hypothetical protein